MHHLHRENIMALFRQTHICTNMFFLLVLVLLHPGRQGSCVIMLLRFDFALFPFGELNVRLWLGINHAMFDVGTCACYRPYDTVRDRPIVVMQIQYIAHTIPK